MTFHEAQKEVRKYRHFLHYTFSNTITQVLMDLYISYQDSLEEDNENRNEIKAAIFGIVDSFKSPESKDRENWSVVSNPERHINQEVLNVLNYILKPDAVKPTSIPDIFRQRIANNGRAYSLNQFYRYR